MGSTTETDAQLSESELLEQIDRAALPRHVAVIMDGNGRWARERGLPRLEGHRASQQSIRDIVDGCDGVGVSFLTLYTFSAENWSRPRPEIEALMLLIESTLRAEADELHRRKARVRHMGDRNGLPQSLLDEIARVEEMTGDNTGLTLQLAINYGGRQEILRAASALAREAASGEWSPSELEEDHFRRHLYLPDSPDPDLLIRTGGETRVSNYLLWQIAYTEIYITRVLWPDFRKRDLYQALLDYQHRDRRFGGVKNG